MADIDLAYKTALSLAAQKESAIEEALDSYFGSAAWTPEEAGAISGMHIYSDGTEELRLGDKTVLRFGPIICKTEIVCSGSVDCLFYQTVEKLY